MKPTDLPRPLSRVPSKDLWLEFLGPDEPASPLNMSNCHCGLCGNSGVIDTRDKVFTAAGVECGVRRFCICPNGRVMQKKSRSWFLREVETTWSQPRNHAPTELANHF